MKIVARGSAVLGSERFRNQIAEILGRRITHESAGRACKAKMR